MPAFKLCPLYEKLSNNPESILPSNYYHLIGDSGVQLASFVLVPHKDYGNLDATKSRYNNKLSKTRYVIENAFGLLKRRFQRLKYLDVMVTKINTQYHISLLCTA